MQFISHALSFNHYKTFRYLRGKVYIDTETKRTSAIKVGSISIRSSRALRQLFLNYTVQSARKYARGMVEKLLVRGIYCVSEEAALNVSLVLKNAT